MGNHMKEIILLKYGELVLKGSNKHVFEEKLLQNLRNKIKPYGAFDVWRAQSAVYVKSKSEKPDIEGAFSAAKKVFGFSSLSLALEVEKNIVAIDTAVIEYLSSELEASRTFKVESKRSDKNFPMDSPSICKHIGATVLEQFPHLTVDLYNPDTTVVIEIRDTMAYIHKRGEKGAGGLPSGSSGRAALLVSGGIDSPVAGYMVARRGVELVAIHFYSYPYTSERSKLKVCDLCGLVSGYAGKIKLYVVPFTRIQEEIRNNCPEEYFTLIMRRMMMKISNVIAKREDCMALVTGESIGQVASQTIQAILATNHAAELPVFRPVIGMDKEEIVAIARRIGTYECSILPYEDCCTIFTPKHPRTKPQLEKVLEVESSFDYDELIAEAIDGVEIIVGGNT